MTWSIPQQQESQNAPLELQDRLLDAVRRLPGVTVSASQISVPGARAFNLEDGAGDPQAFLVPSAREFAHLHPEPDHSLHVALPPALAEQAVRAGWAEQHPVARRGLIPPGSVMLYAPRDDAEVDVVAGLVRASWAWASGAGPG